MPSDFDSERGDAPNDPALSVDPPERKPAAAAARYARPPMESEAENPVTPPDRSDPVDRVEMEKLREMLQEQQKATIRAVRNAVDLQTQLSSAQTEVEAIGKKYYGFSKQARSANAQKTAEIEKLYSQWHQTTRELEKQKQDRRAEAIRAAARLSDAQKELASSGTPAAAGTPAAGERTGKRRVGRAMIAVAAATAILTLSIVVWRGYFSQSPVQRPALVAAEVPDTPAPPLRPDLARPDLERNREQKPAAIVASLPVALAPEPAAAFTSSLTQLDYALSSFPGRDPEEILREASRINHACKLQWNGGSPSLVFGGGSQSNSLSSTIAQCAEAVKKLH